MFVDDTEEEEEESTSDEDESDVRFPFLTLLKTPFGTV